MSASRAATVAAAAQLACLLEVHAPKPGNVSPGRPFADMRFDDFLASAAALGEPLLRAGTQPLGVTIRAAVEATRHWTPVNTNLGIVLLLVPLARAALRLPGDSDAATLRAVLRTVLNETTVADAGEVYAAIRLARPGGLGRVEEEDVAAPPTRPLLEVMRLAEARDGIAREYATGFHTTFETGVPALARARRDGLHWDDALVETFLTMLAQEADTHIARRGGGALALEVTREAAAVLAHGAVRTSRGRAGLATLDDLLRSRGNMANPGTTADLTAAAAFVLLLGGGWQSGGTPAHVAV